MNKKIAATGGALLTMVLGVGCTATIPDPDFGETTRTVMDGQVHDVEAANNPKLGAVEGGDPYRLDAALDAHRTDVAKPEQVGRPININVPN